MRLLSFVVPGERDVRVGLLSHDGARVVDLTAVGVEDMFDAVARAARLKRVAPHLLHSAGAVAYGASNVQVVAPLPVARSAWVERTDHGRRRAPRRGLPVLGDAAPPIDFLDPQLIAGPSAELACQWGVGSLLFGVAGIANGTPSAAGGAPESALAGFCPALRWSGASAGAEAPVGLALGPWIVTPDEVEAWRTGPAQYDLGVTLAVDGTVRYRGSWADEAFALGAVLAGTASSVTLRAGDVLGAVRTARPPLVGEQIVLTIDRLGSVAVRASAAAAGPVATAE